MGKVTFRSLPPTCWKQLFNCVFGHVKRCPLKLFCLRLPFGVENFSLLS